MHAQTDLELHAKKLEKLSNSAYFDVNLKEIARKLVQLIGLVLQKSPKYEELDLHVFADHISIIRLHLEGSTANELPFEIEFCMQSALDDWTSENYTIATAQIYDKNFFFDPISWDKVLNFAERENMSTLNDRLILVGAPAIYNHLPIFCTALYHELGHFIDSSYGISSYVYIKDQQQGSQLFKNELHCGEHFADLFAACYVGNTISNTLDVISPNNQESDTHPATSKRVEIINCFLNGIEFAELSAFQDFLSRLKPRRILEKRFSIPDRAKTDFGDVRPIAISNESEMHGLLIFGWNYLEDMRARLVPDWATELSHLDRVQVVNNLIEKSISNYAASEKWKENKND